MWRKQFDSRQLRLIKNCRSYAEDDPAGMPGHALAIIVAKQNEIIVAAHNRLSKMALLYKPVEVEVDLDEPQHYQGPARFA